MTGGMVPTFGGMWVTYEEHQKAVQEKDAEIARLKSLLHEWSSQR
jgi:hypothetical protein